MTHTYQMKIECRRRVTGERVELERAVNAETALGDRGAYQQVVTALHADGFDQVLVTDCAIGTRTVE